jgi:glycosyltransferase involved in cell wall biosynthesis
LDIFGDGPLRSRLADLISSGNLHESVRLRGWLPHTELASEFARMDVLAFPSVREFGGAVVLEAMAMGVVPIVVDYGGPAELIDSSCGIRIPLADHNGLVTSLRNAITRLIDHPDSLPPMRAAGIKRVDTWFTWQAKARQIFEIYRWVLGRRATKPDFGMPFPAVARADSAREEVATSDQRFVTGTPHVCTAVAS